MILLEFFFFLTRVLKTPWWTGLVLCALFRACSDYFFHTSTPSPFCFIIPHSPRRGQQKRHPAMAGVLGIVGYFRETFSAAHVRYPLDEHERLACRLGRPLGQVPAAPSHGLCRSAGGLPSQSPNGASSPKGGAKSRLPLWGRCHAFGMTERAPCGHLPGALPSGKGGAKPLFPWLSFLRCAP